MQNKRYLFNSIENDLRDRMVFIGGPRQIGKTTLALQLIGADNTSHPAYFNWDFNQDRKKIRQGDLPFNEKKLILDEVHKFRSWRGLVIGP